MYAYMSITEPTTTTPLPITAHAAFRLMMACMNMYVLACGPEPNEDIGVTWLHTRTTALLLNQAITIYIFPISAKKGVCINTELQKPIIQFQYTINMTYIIFLCYKCNE